MTRQRKKEVTPFRKNVSMCVVVQRTNTSHQAGMVLLSSSFRSELRVNGSHINTELRWCRLCWVVCHQFIPFSGLLCLTENSTELNFAKFPSTYGFRLEFDIAQHSRVIYKVKDKTTPQGQLNWSGFLAGFWEDTAATDWGRWWELSKDS